MTVLTRWNPVGEMVSLRQAMDRLFEDSFVSPAGWRTLAVGQAWPLIDVYETNDDVVVSAALPGISPEDVDITLTGHTLTIRGELKPQASVERSQYLYQERRYGTFHRQLTLPVRVQNDHAEASFEHGVLTLHIAKAEEVRPRQIEIKPTAKQIG